MQNIEQIENKCSGCGACKCVCPTDSIDFRLDDEGFYRAFVQKHSCIECKMCLKVCPQNNSGKGVEIRNAEAFSAQAADADIRSSSSSGGIAALLSECAVSCGDVVVGAVYDYDNNLVVHKIADSLQNLSEFKGSKYLQSNPVEAFKSVISFVESDKNARAIIFGTPCQIYGFSLLAEQKKIREKFILVDFFCHGVPSIDIWRSYLTRVLGNNQKLHKVAFRSKTIGWHDFVMVLETDDGESYIHSSESDLFYKAFFDNVFFSRGCYECAFRMTESKADIRLGDFWGRRYQDLNDGVSAIFVFTEEGKKYLNEIQPRCSFLEKAISEEVLNAQSIHKYVLEQSIREYALMTLASTDDLHKTIKNYRKKFPLKRRLKLAMKEMTSVLPNNMRAKIRNVYRKMNS